MTLYEPPEITGWYEHSNCVVSAHPGLTVHDPGATQTKIVLLAQRKMSSSLEEFHSCEKLLHLCKTACCI